MTFLNGIANAYLQSHLVCNMPGSLRIREYVVVEILPAYLSIMFLLIQPDIHLFLCMQPIPLLWHIRHLLLQHSKR